MTNSTDMILKGATSGQYLVFSLGGEEYALDILKVQEIKRYEKTTRIANTPAFVKGVTNLRGVIVPIIDLRVKFLLDNAEYSEDTVFIVVNIHEKVVGFVVDKVSDVMTLDADLMQPTPDFTVSVSSDYIRGLVSIDDRMLIVIDIEKLLSSDDMKLIEKESE